MWSTVMDEGGFALWIRLGAKPNAQMDVHVPSTNGVLDEANDNLRTNDSDDLGESISGEIMQDGLARWTNDSDYLGET